MSADVPEIDIEQMLNTNHEMIFRGHVLHRVGFLAA